jgi:predicted metal-dependent phosphoesterase TrpH
VARAEKAGVCLLALSDHDSVSGFAEAQAAAQGRALDLRCGVEINTSHGENVHILGYGIRWQDPRLLAVLAEYRERRVRRLHSMIEKLGTLGVALTYEDVRGQSPETLGRAHLADALRRKGVVATRAEAFRRFLALGRPAYVESLGPSVEEAIALIRGAGGFAVIAHPGTVADKADIEAWSKAGLEGIEAFYAGHSPSDIIRFQDLADRFGLVVTGGSDYHGRGTGRDGPMGVEVPDEVGRCFLERFSRCA